MQPKNDDGFDTTRVVLTWQQPSAIRKCFSFEITYDLYLDTNYDFSNPQIIPGIIDTTYTLTNLNRGHTYFWKILVKNITGDSLWSTQENWRFYIARDITVNEAPAANSPPDFRLCKNYPNPFTIIKYSLSEPNYITLKLYNLAGREILRN